MIRMTILSFSAIFAGLGLGEAERDYLTATILVFGVFVGSAFRASSWLCSD
jgi:hypothetical protein